MKNLEKEIEELPEFGKELELIEEECDIKSCGKRGTDDCELYNKCVMDLNIQAMDSNTEDNFNTESILSRW